MAPSQKKKRISALNCSHSSKEYEGDRHQNSQIFQQEESLIFCGHLGLLDPEGSVGPKWQVICGPCDQSLCANLWFAKGPHCWEASPYTPCQIEAQQTIHSRHSSNAKGKSADTEEPHLLTHGDQRHCLITSWSHTRPNLIFVLIFVTHMTKLHICFHFNTHFWLFKR